MGSIVTDAGHLVDQLRGVDLAATLDPSEAASIRPCALVLPPAMDYVRRFTTWRVALLSSHSSGTVEALAELDQLLQLALTAGLHIETADPGSYALGDVEAPAYLVRLTT